MKFPIYKGGCQSWMNEMVLKTIEVKASVGSNPTPLAIEDTYNNPLKGACLYSSIGRAFDW